eukprot:1745618-Pleurochrysis_carterae.AAC.1
MDVYSVWQLYYDSTVLLLLRVCACTIAHACSVTKARGCVRGVRSKAREGRPRQGSNSKEATSRGQRISACYHV